MLTVPFSRMVDHDSAGPDRRVADFGCAHWWKPPRLIPGLRSDI